MTVQKEGSPVADVGQGRHRGGAGRPHKEGKASGCLIYTSDTDDDPTLVVSSIETTTSANKNDRRDLE